MAFSVLVVQRRDGSHQVIQYVMQPQWDRWTFTGPRDVLHCMKSCILQAIWCLDVLRVMHASRRAYPDAEVTQ
ncbi:hypothetical protein [Bifidobacterium sp. UTCIF-39]|uniref:hypothetical protein n=1 Tax=Bifidobacterium sp. UTCIF-39 TaxID=1465359 RepID=UPI001126EE69|nr:hypothetical protein [Bifidobacterium sp. UTCIF-39]